VDPADPDALAYYWQHPLLLPYKGAEAHRRHCMDFFFAVTRLSMFGTTIGMMDDYGVFVSYEQGDYTLTFPWRAAVSPLIYTSGSRY
jgi:hypothetical protein